MKKLDMNYSKSIHEQSSNTAKFKLGWNNDDFEFGVVTTDEDRFGVQELRMKMYRGKRSYLSSLINHNGEDEFDKNSYVFFAKYQLQYIASVRLNRYPFEASKYLPPESLEDYLGFGYEKNFLEVGRLVVDPVFRLPTLSSAMLAYAFSMVTSMASHKGYIGYSHPRLKNIAFKYHQAAEIQEFFISERRQTPYVLFKGSFVDEIRALHANYDLKK